MASRRLSMFSCGHHMCDILPVLGSWLAPGFNRFNYISDIKHITLSLYIQVYIYTYMYSWSYAHDDLNQLQYIATACCFWFVDSGSYSCCAARYGQSIASWWSLQSDNAFETRTSGDLYVFTLPIFPSKETNLTAPGFCPMVHRLEASGTWTGWNHWVREVPTASTSQGGKLLTLSRWGWFSNAGWEGSE